MEELLAIEKNSCNNLNLVDGANRPAIDGDQCHHYTQVHVPIKQYNMREGKVVVPTRSQEVLVLTVISLSNLDVSVAKQS